MQEVQGFPTVKVFPRGGQLPPQKYESGERTSNNLIKWASRSVPNKIKSFPNQGDIPNWLDKVRLLPHLGAPALAGFEPSFESSTRIGLTCVLFVV